MSLEFNTLTARTHWLCVAPREAPLPDVCRRSSAHRRPTKVGYVALPVGALIGRYDGERGKRSDARRIPWPMPDRRSDVP